MVVTTLQSEMDLPYDDCISPDMCPDTPKYIEDTCSKIVDTSKKFNSDVLDEDTKSK